MAKFDKCVVWRNANHGVEAYFETVTRNVTLKSVRSVKGPLADFASILGKTFPDIKSLRAGVRELMKTEGEEAG